MHCTHKYVRCLYFFKLVPATIHSSRAASLWLDQSEVMTSTPISDSGAPLLTICLSPTKPSLTANRN